MAKYYVRITLKRMAELLELTEAVSCEIALLSIIIKNISEFPGSRRISLKSCCK